MAGRRGDNPVPILPASRGDSRSQSATSCDQSSPPKQAVHLPKRASVRVACEGCRKRRIRCGGQRPSCWQCVQRGDVCVYEAEEGETVSLALRRRLAEVEAENSQYKELYDLLRDRQEDEAGEILHRLKASDNPLHVLSIVKEAQLLLTTPGRGISPSRDDLSSSPSREARPSSSGQTRTSSDPEHDNRLGRREEKSAP